MAQVSPGQKLHIMHVRMELEDERMQADPRKREVENWVSSKF